MLLFCAFIACLCGSAFWAGVFLFLHWIGL